MLIDSHQHFWDLEREDCCWPTPDLTAIYKNFGVKDYKITSTGLGITGSILVQSQPCDSDTDYLLDIAENSEDILAVVGWVDLAGGNAETRINALAKYKKLRGIRPMLQAIDDSAWIMRKELQPAINVMQALKLSFDALIQPRHLSTLVEFAKANSKLRIVIDHAAKPDIANNEFDGWAEAIAEFENLENVYCKLSGLVTEAAQVQIEKQDVFLPYVEKLFACFGARRLMWGSDWPVLNLRCDIREWLQMAQDLLQKCGAHKDEVEAIFGGTALKFYCLDS